MSYFNAADWIVIIVYLALMIGIGMWAARGQKSTKDYFLGSKNIGWFGIGLSIVAAETSALTIIGVPAQAYGGNITFIQVIIGYVIARIILAVVMVPHYLKGEIYSPYQLLENAFGKPARRCSGAIFLIMETLAAGVRVYVASIPVKLILGDQILGGFTKPFLVPWMKLMGQPIPENFMGDPILGSILLFVFLSLIYTYFGGVKAVIWTDAIQFCLFLGGGIFTLCYIPTLIDGGWHTVVEKAYAAGKLQWFNGKFTLGLPFNIWMGVIGGTFVVLSSHGAEQLIVQRVLACKNVSDGRKALTLSAVLIFPMFLIFLLCGVLLWVFYQTHAMQIPLPEPKPGIKAYDFIFPIFMVTEVPHVLKGFLIVAILAAAMSSISSALTSLASVSTMDIVKGLMKDRPEGFYFKVSRYSTILWAAALIAVAYISRETKSVLDAAFLLRGLTSGALLGGLMLVVFWKRESSWPPIVGMVVSMILVTLLVLFYKWPTEAMDPITCKLVPVMDPATGKPVMAGIAWPWLTLIGTTITVGVAWLTRAAMGRKAEAV